MSTLYILIFFGSALTQWNSEGQKMNVNFRLQYIPKVGADFYLIINQIFNTEEGRVGFFREVRYWVSWFGGLFCEGLRFKVYGDLFI